MQASIDGPRQRIGRAKRRLETLSAEMQLVTQNNYYRIVARNFDPRTDRYELRVGNPILEYGVEFQPIRPEWAISISEIAHHLRAALDGLVWQLCYLNGHTDQALLALRPRPEFPLYTNSKNRSLASCETEVGKRISALNASHQAMIRGLQPYRPGNLGVRNSLWLLHEINNADKHRLLQVVTVSTAAVAWSSRGHRFQVGSDGRKIHPRRPLVPGSKIGWATKAFVADVDMTQTSAAGIVAFWEGCAAVKGVPVIGLLMGITNAVDRVIEAFARDFT